MDAVCPSARSVSHGQSFLVSLLVRLTTNPPCSLDELVKDGVNGLVFHDAEQLAAQLEASCLVPSTTLVSHGCFQSLPRGFPSPPALSALRAAFQQRASEAPGSRARAAHQWEWGTWTENWDHTMRPLLLHDVATEAEL